MVLLDTCMWVDALRPTGKPEVRARVDDLMSRDEACWCDVVLLELWNGARGYKEYKSLRYLETVVRSLPTDQQVWDRAFELARNARSAGLTVPAQDLMIVACARRHSVPLESSDAHMNRLSALP